jgi:hypothetical protein
MTDFQAPGTHPTDEQLSAALDGQDAGAAEHARGCTECQSRLDGLRAVIALVAQPPPIDPAARDRAVAAAVAATAVTAPITSLPPPEARRRFRWNALAAAAVVVIAAAVSLPLVLRGSAAKNTASRTFSAQADRAGVRNGGDLGEVSDPGALLSKVGPELRTASSGAAASGGDSGAAASTTTGPANQTMSGASPAARSGGKGTTDCAPTVAQQYGQGLGPLVYRASVRYAGTPAQVLAYVLASPSGRLDHRVFVMSDADCTLLTVLSL